MALARIKSLPLILPPLQEQHEIVRRVEQLFAYADTIEKQVNNALTRVNSLTQSILAKAFRGELTAQWRAENPELISGENSAAALLEKLRPNAPPAAVKKPRVKSLTFIFKRTFPVRFLLFPRNHNHQKYIQFIPEHSHYSLFSAGLFFYLLMLCTGI